MKIHEFSSCALFENTSWMTCAFPFVHLVSVLLIDWPGNGVHIAPIKNADDWGMVYDMVYDIVLPTLVRREKMK